MDKAQALHSFWSSFGLPAYDQLTVPDDAKMPYITYEVATDSFDSTVYLTASIWYNNFSWKEVTEKSEQIAKVIYDLHPSGIKIDGGRLLIFKGSPFATRMNDENDKMVRRIILNIMAEFLTAY